MHTFSGGRYNRLHILEIKLRTMTDMYRAPRVSEAKLTAYPHEERGQEVRGWKRQKRAGFDASVGRVVAGQQGCVGCVVCCRRA